MLQDSRPTFLPGCAALGLSLAIWYVAGSTGSVLHGQPNPAVVGQWSTVQTWPVVSVHATLLPTGKVLFNSYADDPRLWDPASGSITAASQVGFNLFCSGHTLLSDGRLFVGGGHISNDVGLNTASIYDATTNSWSRQPDMNAGRWYPTTTTLADGSVVIVSGDIDTTVGVNRLPQVWANGTWRDLTSAQIAMPLYPFMLLAPNGRVFNAGPQQATRYLDTSGTGTWINSASSAGFRSYGTAVMYEPGKVLLVGGADPPVASAEVIDLNQQSPAWRRAGDMATPRRQLNATVLPDSTVLITGGSSGAGFNNASAPVYPAERWNPASEQFTTLASATRYRGYHSIALLLPDGRVLSSGGDNEPNAEVFSPPYLFQGARPVVTSVPSTISYGHSFFVTTPDAASIAAVTLIRLSSVTHSFNMNQRFLRLPFLQGAGGVNVTAPSVAELAPPGDYMLFLVNGSGVPAVAPIVRLNTGPAPTAPAAPSNLSAAAVSSTQINLSWTDNASNELGYRVERSPDNTSFSEIATIGPNGTSYTDTGLNAGTPYWYRVRAYNAVGPSASAGPVTATTQAASVQPPSAPTGLTMSARTTGAFTMAWSDSASNEDGFYIERSSDGRSFTQIAQVAKNVTTYIDGTPGTAKFIYYRVRAFNAAGTSGYSNTLKIRNR